MITIILVTHGSFASGIVESSEMLVGESKKLGIISLEPSDDFDDFQLKIALAAEEMDDGSGVLALVDLLGGSPYNAVARNLRNKNIECLTGLNLSMLLTALEQREYCDLKQLANECRDAAITDIVNVREFLTAQSDGEDRQYPDTE